MAPSRRTPRQERAPLNYDNIGQVGRRTGATWKDSGVRDENGLEPMPSFSSPERPAFQPNGGAHESTYTADDSMDIGQSTIAEPDVVVRSVRNARTSIPRSISPIKTHINGSARRPIPRTTAQLSSPSGNVNGGTPSQPPVNRQLDFSMDKTRTISKLSPRNPSSISSKGLKKTTTDKRGKKKGPFDLAADSDEGEPEASAMNEMSIDNGVAQDDYMPNIDDEPLNPDVTMESIEEQDQALVPEEEPLDMEPEPEVTTGATAPPKRPSGRPAKASLGNPDESVMSLGGTGARRGRPPKKPKTEVYQDENAAKPAAPAAAKGKRKAGTSERDPNIKVKAPRTNSKAPASRAPSVAPSRSYIVQRSETPATDSGAFVTRSGRHSFKPLASWRGEHVVLGQRETADTLPAITDIVRTDEMMAPPRKRSASVRPGPGKRRARPQLAAVEEEEEEELEPWEAETGIQYAQVMSWNAEAAKYEEDHTTETEIAYAADAIEMRDISGASFKFAKTLTVPFFGAGMVHLPPGGEKRVKNSRKMQMVFFVFYGRVTVNVGTPTTTFSLGRGGQWQVPRGNFYSIINESDNAPARMFFAQGCEWSEAGGENSIAE